MDRRSKPNFEPRGRSFGGGGGGGDDGFSRGRGRGGAGRGRGGRGRGGRGGGAAINEDPEHDQSARVRADPLLRSARHEHFFRNARQDKLKENRRVRDEETMRMEMYRKLCEREGIQSERLKQYDEKKKHNAEQLDSALKSIDSDTKMSNKERKQAKFRLKRRASERTTEMQDAVKSVGQILAHKAQKLALTREEQQAKKEEEIQERIAQKEEKLAVRRKKAKAFSLRTSKGQPVMAGRVRSLLDKVMNS